MAMTLAVANAWTTAKSAIPTHHHFKPSKNCSGVEISIAAKSCSGLRLALSIPKSPIVGKHCHHSSRDNSKLLCCCSKTNECGTSTSSSSSSDDSISPSEWDWNRWQRHITQVELLETRISHLKVQLEVALENEDFEEAKYLKTAISESMLMDTVDELMSKLERAIDEERYHDASELGRISRLVGWWVGYSNYCVDEPSSLTPPDCGRIVRITPGVGRFIGRVYGRREYEAGSQGTPLFEIFVVKDTDTTYTTQVVLLQRPYAAEVENASVMDVQIGEDLQNDNTSTKTDGSEDIRSITDVLKEKLSELKLENPKIMKSNIIEDVAADVKQLIEEIDENALSSENSKDEKSDLGDSQPDGTIKEGKDLGMKPFISGVLHEKEDMPTKDEYVRVPVVIEEMEQDSFVLHVESIESKICNRLEKDKFARDEFCLYEFTNFSRISTSRGDLEPFNGLYIAPFVGNEVLQLRRKYGCWGDNNDFFEYVEAVKLTGIYFAPPGQVAFRAKIPKGFRLSDPRRSPVIGRLSGEGKLLSFRGWERCELLLFANKLAKHEVAGICFNYTLDSVVSGKHTMEFMYMRWELPE